MSYETGPDGTPEREAIVARLKGALVGGRVYDDLPDATDLPRGATGELLPFVFVTFTSPAPTTTDRALGGSEADQPHLMGVSVECWATTTPAAGRVAGAVRRVLIGWAPNGSSGELYATGGGQFTARSTQALPSRTMEQVRLFLPMNLGIPTL